MDFYQSHHWNNAIFPFIYNKTAALQHSSVPHFNINIYICCIVAPYVSDVQLISCDIKKRKCPIRPCKKFKKMMCRQFTLEQWAWLSNTSLRGHLKLCMCTRCCCRDQLWRGSGYICHLPHTRSESWASPPRARRRKATPPQGRGILQRRARFEWRLSLLSCEKHFPPPCSFRNNNAAHWNLHRSVS